MQLQESKIKATKMIINYYIKRNEKESINFINRWTCLEPGENLYAKYNKSDGDLGIVQCIEFTSFKNHFKLNRNDFCVKESFMDLLNKIIDGCSNGNKDNIKCVNIIIHWGGDEPSEYKKMTENLKAEVDTYCKKDKDSCKYEYKFYFYTTVLDDKYQTLKKIMYFNNGWEEILNDKFSIEEVKRFPILNSLFILCQGYLAVYRSWGDYKRNEKVLEALQNMGWIDVDGRIKTDVTGFLPGSLGNKFVEVSNGSWWKKPFDDTSFDNGKFEKALIKECEGNNDLYNKVMEIFNNGDGIEPVVVAEVYLGLVKEWVQ